MFIFIIVLIMSYSNIAPVFFLSGILYPNNSVVALPTIGTENNALFCLSRNTLGNWKFPNESALSNSSSGANIYTTRRPNAVLLHSRNNAMEPTGVFTCEVTDDGGVLRSLYILIYVGQVSGTQYHVTYH